MLQKKRILILLSALCYFLSFPPFVTGFLSYGALALFFLALDDVRPAEGFRLGTTWGLVSIGGLMHWLCWNSGATLVQAVGMYVMAVLYLSLAWGLFGLVQAWLRQAIGRRAFLAAPFLWSGLEYLQSRGELGFSWHSLATTQTFYTPVIQFISITGMYGLTFWIAFLNTVVYFMVIPQDDGHPFLLRRTLAAVLAGMFALPWIYGAVVLARPSEPVRTVRVTIVQPNIEPNRKWIEMDFAYRELMRLTREGAGDPTDLIIWPETALPDRLRTARDKFQSIQGLLKERPTCLLTGNPDKKVVRNDQGRPVANNYNSILLIRPDQPGFQSYDKMHLVPFGEHVPGFLSFLEDFAMDVGVPDYSEGQSPTIFVLPIFRDSAQVDSIAFSSVVCLESVFAHMVQRTVHLGARFLVIVTNDAWYDGTFGPAQHARIAVLRAVENRISVARSANSGISSVIDPFGRILEETAEGEQVVITGSVPVLADAGQTMFARWGSWFGWLCVGVSFAAVMMTGVWSYRQRSSR